MQATCEARLGIIFSTFARCWRGCEKRLTHNCGRREVLHKPFILGQKLHGFAAETNRPRVEIACGCDWRRQWYFLPSARKCLGQILWGFSAARSLLMLKPTFYF